MAMKKKYSILLAPILWCFVPDFYRDVARRWKGICALYLLLLMAVVCIPLIVGVARGYAEFMDAYGREIIDQIPPITITGGEVHTPVEQPYAIDLPEKEGKHVDKDLDFKHLAVIDTTGQITTLEQAQAPVLLTKSQLIYRKGEHETSTMDLREVDDFRMDKDDVARWAAAAGKWLPYVLYPVVTIGSYIGRLIQILLYGAVGLLFSLMCGSKLGYAAAVRLSAVAITPIVLADMILDLAGVQIGAAWTWGGVLIAMVLLFFGAAVNRGEPAPSEAAGYAPPILPGQPGQPPPPPPGAV